MGGNCPCCPHSSGTPVDAEYSNSKILLGFINILILKCYIINPNIILSIGSEEPRMLEIFSNPHITLIMTPYTSHTTFQLFQKQLITTPTTYRCCLSPCLSSDWLQPSRCGCSKGDCCCLAKSTTHVISLSLHSYSLIWRRLVALHLTT